MTTFCILLQVRIVVNSKMLCHKTIIGPAKFLVKKYEISLFLDMQTLSDYYLKVPTSCSKFEIQVIVAPSTNMKI